MTETIDTAQPEALRLATLMDAMDYDDTRAAAKELRILEAENQVLRSSFDRLGIAFNEWSDKTYWVRKTVQPQELGKHIADVLRERIERLTSELAAAEARNATLTDDAARWRHVRDEPYTEEVARVMRYQLNASMDQAIDAARAAASISTKGDGHG